MIIVPSTAPRSRRDAAQFLKRLSGMTSPAELRIDGFTPAGLGTLLARPRPPLIVTCRSRREGGLFGGSARSAAEILMDAAASGAEYVDAEYSLGPPLLKKMFATVGRQRIILSFHDTRSTPAGLPARFRAMAALRPAVVKIAVTPRCFADTRLVLGILDEARAIGQPVVAIAMGEFGSYTRVLQGVFGGALTYASPDASVPTAPGQLPLPDMAELYRADLLNRRTRIFGLLGYPVEFSRGIRYHNPIFAKKRANAVYVNFAADDDGAFIDMMSRRITGLSVTMPFKRSVAGHLDRVDDSALISGSVNTVLRKSGKLSGSNTDFQALLSLLRKRIHPAGKRMLVLGTGGTAGTVAGVGAVSGAKVTIAGRDTRAARALADRFGCAWMPLSGEPSFDGDILVNATPVGMDPAAGSADPVRIVPPSSLGKYALVCDFANPPGGRRTALIADAQRRGLRVISGGEIFEAQARLQSRMFLELL